MTTLLISMPDDTIKFYKTEAFKKLNAKWQKTLKESGFEDLENPSDPDLPLPASLNTRTARYKDRPQVEAHFEQALHLLNNGKFDSKVQKQIWELYCKGATERLIASRVGISKTAVHEHLVKCRDRL